MSTRIAIVLTGLVTALPVQAAEMRADEARRFVIGKLFSYTCFDGTSGAGRVYADGSVIGTIRNGNGRGGVRFMAMPAGTLRVKGDSVCASVRGMPFEPCFSLQKTSATSFRGSLGAFGIAYCDFTRRGRAELAETIARPTRRGNPTAAE
jgi:hypothetical protein